MRKAVCTFALFTLLAAVSAVAGPVSGSMRVRIENWNWFDTRAADDSYTFLGAQLRVAAKKTFGSVEGQIEVEAPLLSNLPEAAALAPPRGQLGLGGAYYQANGETSPAGLFVKQAFVRTGGFRLGRFEFVEGNEHLPSDATLAAIRRDRVAHRLVGTFAFSHVGRSFDGLQFDGKSWTLLAARPTAGVFKVDGGRNLDVDLLYASRTQSSAGNDRRIFFIGYRDHRDVVKTDNRPAAARAADREEVRIGTIGGHHVVAYRSGDVLVWGAYQWGDWGRLSHRATAFDIEGSARFAKGSLRAGWYRSSGDGDAADDRHETFFTILPTPRIYARFPFYNAMNSSDVFVQGTLRPNAKLTLQTEMHNLTLSNRKDLWYAGGGAFDDRSFGYAGRPSSGRGDLATVVDLSAELKVNAKTTVTFYAARALGGNVVRSIFAGESALFAYVEMMRRF